MLSYASLLHESPVEGSSRTDNQAVEAERSWLSSSGLVWPPTWQKHGFVAHRRHQKKQNQQKPKQNLGKGREEMTAAAAAVQSRKSARKRSRSPGKRLGSRKRQTSASDNLEKESGERERNSDPPDDSEAAGGEVVKLTAPKTIPVVAVPSKTVAEELLDADEVEKLVGPSLVDPVGRDDHGQGLSPVSCALKGCTVS